MRPLWMFGVNCSWKIKPPEISLRSSSLHWHAAGHHVQLLAPHRRSPGQRGSAFGVTCSGKPLPGNLTGITNQIIMNFWRWPADGNQYHVFFGIKQFPALEMRYEWKSVQWIFPLQLCSGQPAHDGNQFHGSFVPALVFKVIYLYTCS